MRKFLFYNKFIICLCMFRALLCSSSGGQNCIIQHLVSSHSVGSCPVHRLREDSYSIPFYSIVFYSVLFCSVLFYSILLYSILFDCILFCSVLFYSILFYSILFYSILLCSIVFCSILFYSSLNLCAGRPPTECDGARCCIIQF